MDKHEVTQKIAHSFRNTQVGYIAECLEPVSGMMSIDDVLSMIDEKTGVTSLPVEENGSVTGLVPLKILENKHGSLWESLVNANVSKFTNHSTQIIDAMDNVERALLILISRKTNPYDDFLILHNGSYFGVGSFMKLTEHITKLRDLDLTKARELQRFLFRLNVSEKDKMDVKALVKTAHSLGGDFYIALPLRNDISLVACFDVSGKNVSASLTTSMLGAFFSTMMNTERFPEMSPAEVVNTLNKVVFDQTPAETYITGVMLFADRQRGTIDYYNLGHTPVFLFSNEPDGKTRIKVLNPNLMPLGIGELDELDKNVKKIPIVEGMRFFMYSDGLTEARDKFGKMYGEEELKKFLISTYKHTLSDLIDDLDGEIARFTNGVVLPDDITVLAVEYK